MARRRCAARIPTASSDDGSSGTWQRASLRIDADLTSIDPEQTITRLGVRPVLLIHGGKDRVDVPATSAERVFAVGRAAGVPIESVTVRSPLRILSRAG